MQKQPQRFHVTQWLIAGTNKQNTGRRPKNAWLPGRLTALLLMLFALTVQWAIAQTPTSYTVMGGHPSVGGYFDTLFDKEGQKYSIEDLRVITAGSRFAPEHPNAVASVSCSSGYFDLYFENGSGMEGASAVEVNRRNVLCQLFQDLSTFINVGLGASSDHVKIWVRDITHMGISNPSVSGTLGLASSFHALPSSPLPGIADNLIWQTIVSGTDAYSNVASPLIVTSGGQPYYYHGQIAFNFANPSINWHTNLPTATGAGLYDLYSVGLHEATHALGFASLISQTGASKYGAAYPYYSRYDMFLKTQAGTALLTNTVGCQMYNWGFNSSLSTSILQPGFTGSCTQDHTDCLQAINYVGSVTQPVYTPDCFSDGSSLSHFEDECQVPPTFTVTPSNNAYFVMSNANGSGAAFMKRYLKPEERLVLCDLGYSVNTTYGSAFNLTNYNYGGSVCPGLNVAGTNDGINGSVYAYITPVSTPLLISNVLANDFNATSIECVQVVNGAGTISGLTSTAFSYAPSSSGLHLLRYVPVSSTGGRGNITYVYVYAQANCTPSPCNIVSNGTFEAASGCGYMSYTLNCWQNLRGTSDLFSTGCISGGPPYGYYNTGVNTLNSTPAANAVSGNRFIGFWSSGNTTLAYGSEAFQNSLSSPLVPNSIYDISFWAVTNNNVSVHISNTVHPTPVQVYAMPNISVGTTAMITNTATLPAGSVLLGTTMMVPAAAPGVMPWSFHTMTFTYTGVSNANAIAILIDPHQMLTYGDDANVFVDNLSILPLGTAPVLSLPTASVCPTGTISNLQLYASPSGGSFAGPGITNSGPGVYHFSAPATAGPGTYMISYTYTNGLGCPLTTYTTVTVLGSGSFTGNMSANAFACAGSSVTLSANTMPAGVYSYTWSAPLSVNTQTAALTPANNAIYTCTISNQCGSTQVVSACIDVVSTECCLGAENIPANTTITTGGAYSTITGARWNVNGPIVINGNITWRNADFRMMAGAKITILPGAKLTLDHCRLFSCTGMWEGITLQPGAAPLLPKIEVTNSSIEDAYKAIYYDAQNTNWYENIITSGSVFNKNYIGIDVENIIGLGPLFNIYVAVDDDFTSQSSSTSPGSSLKCSSFYSPLIRTRSYAGVYFNNQQINLHLGDETFNPANANTYDNMDYGVYLNNSVARIFKSTFSNMSGPGLIAFPPPTGTGVYSTNTLNNSSSMLHVEQCGFVNVNKGIDMINAWQIDLISNQFSVTAISPNVYGTSAISAFNTSRVVTMHQNYITNFETGINNTWSAPVAASNFSLSVFQNTITSGGTASAYCTQAITLNDAINTFSTTGRNLVISSNQASVVNNGIAITNVKFNLKISNNNMGLLYASSGTRTGIKLNGTQNASVDNNSVSSSSTANASLRGIHLQLSPNCLTNCNTVSNTGQAFTFEGNCLTGTAGFVNNTINNAYDGMVLKNNGVIGTQGFYTLFGSSSKTTHNQWLGSYVNSKTLVMDAGSSSTNSKMYVQNNANELPAPQSLNKTFALFGSDNYGTLTTNSPASLLPQAYASVACPSPNTTGYRVAAPDSTEEAEKQALRDNSLYQLITGTELANESKEINGVYVFSLFEQGYTTSHIGLNAFYDAQKDSLQDYTTVDSLIQVQEVYAASNQNAALQASTSIQQNQQLINAALIKHTQNPDAEFTEAELEDIYNLALKCPLSEGTAVYQARVLFCALSKQYIQFADNCDTGKGSRKAKNLEEIEASFCKLYPNPSQGKITLSYRIYENANICIYDVSGRMLYSHDLNKEASTLQLQTKLAEGVYVYTITTDSGTLLKTDKLIVIH